MVAQWLNLHQLQAQKVEEIPDLATGDREAFRWAMTELISWCDGTLSGYRKDGWHVVFNLTGGFKSVNGFLQAVGMFYAHESVYIFQSSSQLLRIPQLPIALDKEGTVGKHLQAFRKLAIWQCLSASECEGVPETLLIQLDESVELSEWGKLVWLQSKPQYYEQELLPPLSDRLVYSEPFMRTANELPRERLAIVNERLDQLSRCLDDHGSNSEYNLKSLDFKPLKGKPFPDSTHECDAWSDQDAKRLYGHYESNGQFMIDRLGKHR